MGKIAVVANKYAGRGAALRHVLCARAELWGRPCEVIFPDSVEDLQQRCARIAKLDSEYDALVVIGGDGTINQAIRQLQPGNTVPIYPFPSGTANDLAKELNLNADWSQLQWLLDQHRSTLIDLIEVNGIFFSTVAGVGLGSHITEEFNRRRHESWIFTTLAQALRSQIYTALGAKTVLLQRNYLHNVKLRSATFSQELRTPAVFVCNQTRLGGDLNVAPKIGNNDDRFNVLVVTSTSRLRLLAAMAELKAGKLSREFIVFSTDHLSIADTDGREIPVFGDGESLTSSSQLEFKIIPKSFNVFRDARRHLRRQETTP